MRRLSPVIASFAIGLGPVAASEFRWPDPGISIPPLVRAYIHAECVEFQGSSEEDVGACMRGEAYGYRAVVTMLTDDEEGEHAARRYRACRAGLGAEGGRFHRRRAECIGKSLGYHWRFEFSQRASRGEPGRFVETALEGAEPPDNGPSGSMPGVALAASAPARQAGEY